MAVDFARRALGALKYIDIQISGESEFVLLLSKKMVRVVDLIKITDDKIFGIAERLISAMEGLSKSQEIRNNFYEFCRQKLIDKYNIQFLPKEQAQAREEDLSTSDLFVRIIKQRACESRALEQMDNIKGGVLGGDRELETAFSEFKRDLNEREKAYCDYMDALAQRCVERGKIRTLADALFDFPSVYKDLFMECAIQGKSSSRTWFFINDLKQQNSSNGREER